MDCTSIPVITVQKPMMITEKSRGATPGKEKSNK